MKKVMKASVITGIRAAEDALAREDSRWMNEEIDRWDDNELKREAKEVSGKLNNDLSSLPETHPLKIALEEARKRYEAEETQKESEEEKEYTQNNSELRRVKKVNEKKERQESRQRDDDWNMKCQDTVKVYNSCLNEALKSITKLKDDSLELMNDLEDNRYAMSKFNRLKNMLQTVERGLMDSRMDAGRLNNG